MPRIHFQQQLFELKDKLLAMAALSQQALECSVEAYLNNDTSLCHHVRSIEAAINSAERDVDEMAYELLAKEQPMAIDLRFILAVIKINGDLERVGDQSISICDHSVAMATEPKVKLPVDMETMGEFCGRMVRNSIQALVEADVKMAEAVLEMDDEMDAMNNAAHKNLVLLMQENSGASKQALSAIMVARNLERCSDHATNIAEDVIFWVRGSDIRHKMSLSAD